MESNTLYVGVARVDITPPIGIQLFGYHRAGRMADIHDPLGLTALTVASTDGATDPLVILAVDHIGMTRAAADRLRRAAASAAGTPQERVMVCFSHTHSGPDTEGVDCYGSPRPRDALEYVYGATLPAQAATAVHLAVQRAVPARVGTAQTMSIVGINRRPRTALGHVVATGVNPAGPTDPQVAVLRFEASDGRPVATLVHCGVHGTVFKKDNLACSADVTGAARLVVEAATGAPCLVVQGAAGDVNPRWRGDEAALRQAGWELGGAALRALALTEMEPLKRIRAGTAQVSMRLLPLPNEEEAAQRAAEVARIWDSPTGAWLEALRRRRAAAEQHPQLSVELQAIRLNDFVRVGMPLEPFSGLALALRERIGSSSGCIAFGGYTNGCIGYLPTAAEHAAGGYEIEWSPVVYGHYEGFLMPPVAEAADEVVTRAVQLVEALSRDQGGDQNS